MFKFLKHVSFLLLVCLSVAHSNDACIKIVDGALVQPPYPFRVRKTSRVFRLGEGIMGGVVYRVVGVSGRTRTLKVYQSERDAALDLHRLNALRRLLSEKAPTDSDRFKVARARLISPKVLQIQNVYGMTLQDVFDNLYLPLALKNELEWKYEQSLEHLQGLLKETYRSASLSYNGWFVVTREDHDALGFLLKYDNIIVTPNKNLVIVDPY